MAFNFIKKVFSFGRKQESEAPEPAAEVLAPLSQPESLEGTAAVAPPAEILPPLRQPEPIEPDPILAEIAPELTPTPGSPVRAEAIDEADRMAEGSGLAADASSTEAEAPAAAVEAPSTAEIPPSGPSGHLPLEKQEDTASVSPAPDVAPTPPSPLRATSTGEADQGGVAEELALAADAPSAAVEAPRAVEMPSSGPAGDLPFEGGEDAVSPAPEPAPTPPSPAAVSIGEAALGGAGEAPGAAVEAPRPAEDTPSGPSGHFTPEVGEEARRPSSPAAAAGKVTVARKVEQKAEATRPAEPAARASWFQRLRQGLSRSSKELSGNIAGVFTKRKLDEDTLQDLEDVLIRADLGMETAIRVTDALASGRYGKSVSDEDVRTIMAQEVEKVLKPVAMPLELDLSHKPHVVLVVGVNGTGKTTTIGKLAAKLVDGGLSVTLAAGDTFRAAAIEQLKIWGERTGSQVVSSKLGADAAGLAYDAFEKARQAGSDVLIIDTAGRLQNKAELMAELEKIVRVLGKLDAEAPHTVLQTVDATTGQNALNQVEIFRNVAGVNGLVMTKLDGTARGGILVAIAARHKLPVYFIGVGEQVDDLEPFSASDFAKAIAGVA